nr:MAG TPA: hypothetical protein [Caudoviricetes sp.]
MTPRKQIANQHRNVTVDKLDKMVCIKIQKL